MKTFLFCGLAALALAVAPLASRADVNCLKKSVTFDLRSAYSGKVLIDGVRRIYLSVTFDENGSGMGTLTLDPNTVKGEFSTAVAVQTIRVRVELVKDENHAAKGRRVYKLTRAEVEGERVKGEDHWLLVSSKEGSTHSLVFLDGKGKFRDTIALEPVPSVRRLDVSVDDFQRTKAGKPKLVEIGSADDLAKATLFRDDDGRNAVAKLVDFSKEKLVVFVWKGSNTDEITDWWLKSGTVTFAFTAGYGEDLPRVRVLAFAVPKDTTVEFGETRRVRGIDEWFKEVLHGTR